MDTQIGVLEPSAETDSKSNLETVETIENESPIEKKTSSGTPTFPPIENDNGGDDDAHNSLTYKFLLLGMVSLVGAYVFYKKGEIFSAMILTAIAIFIIMDTIVTIAKKSK